MLFASVFMLSCATQKSQHKYSTVEYKAGACFGSCPIFTITINPDRTAIFEAEHFNFSKTFSKGEFDKPREGTFTGIIKESDYQKLIQLLDGLKVKSLNEKYGNRNVTDMATCYLTVKFADGTTAKSMRFKLKSVKIGDKVVYDVTCSISNSLDAPMLLGQSVLSKFGSYTFDYKNGKLIIE